MALKEEVDKILSGPRVEVLADADRDNDTINLIHAVNELRAAVLKIAEEIDKRLPAE